MAQGWRVIARVRVSLFRRGQAGQADRRDASGRAVRKRIAEVGRQYQYHAFISYARRPDSALAQRLRQSLRRVAAHWWERGQLRVFLDKQSLPAGQALDDRLKDALDHSATLILLASESSAASPWVRREVRYFRGLGREILIANAGRIDGNDNGIRWSTVAADFDWDASPVLSDVMLGGAFTAEPAWEDLSKARWHPFLHPGIVRDGAASLAASILGVAKESLLVREARRQRARVAVAVVAAAAVVATATVSLLASSLATQESGQEKLNTAQHLLDAATHSASVSQALLLTAAAYRVAPGSVARDRLMEQAALNPGLRRVLLIPPGGIGTVESVGYRRGGGLLAAAASSSPAGSAPHAVLLLWHGDGTGPPAEATVSSAAFATSVDFSPDGRVLAVGDSSGAITLVTVGPAAAWPPRLVTGPRLGPPARRGAATTGPVSRVSFAPAGGRLAASYGDGRTVIWQLATRRAAASFPGTVSQFSPAGTTLASLEPGAGTLAVRDAGTLTLRVRYRAGVEAPANLAYRPDGKAIAVTSGSISLNGASPAVAVVDVTAGTTHPIGATLGTGPVAYGGSDEVATDSELILAAGTAAAAPDYRAPRMTVQSIAFDPAAGLMAVGGSWPDGSGGDVLLMDTGTAAFLPGAAMPPGRTAAGSTGFPASALSPSGRTLAITGPDGQVGLLTAATGQPTRPVLRGGVAAPTRLAFSPAGTELAGLNGRLVTIWSLRDGTVHDFYLPLGRPVGEPGGMAFSPDGRRLAVVAPSGQIMLLRTAFPLTATTLAAAGAACDLAFSPDGQRLAVATPGGAQLWDVASGKHVATLAAGPDPAGSSGPVPVDGTYCTGTVAVSFLSQGARLAATDGHVITIWTVAGATRTSLPPPLLNAAASSGPNPGFDLYTHLASSPDGVLLAAGTSGGAVFLWDTATRRQIGPALPSPVPIAAVGFGPGGNTVISFGASAMAWTIDPRYWLTWACDAAQRNLSTAEWNLAGTGIPRIKECSQWPL
jgi:WD40 repeat protein